MVSPLPAFGKIGHGKARRERQRDVVLVLEPPEHRIQASRRLEHRALRRQSGEKIQRSQGFLGRATAGERAIEQARGPLAGHRHVHMRIRPVRDQSVAAVDHCASHVGVKIEARDDGDPRSDDVAHAPENLAFTIVEMLGHHRAMQVEVDAVDSTRVGEAC